jgi:twitching motility two-component system response regulator PilH
MKKPFSRFEVFARLERLLDENMVPRRVISADKPMQQTSAADTRPI